MVAPWHTDGVSTPVNPPDAPSGVSSDSGSGRSSVISQRRQRWISAGILLLAVGALILAALYGEDDSTGSSRAAGLGASASDTTLAPSADAVAPATQIIEEFLPVGGEASACSEPVGVDLVGGYGARLTINGIEIAPEEMNVNLDANGEITNVLTPTRTLGQFTFQPTDECPNGKWLRPVDNVLDVCVYRFDDPSASCALRTEFRFDAL